MENLLNLKKSGTRWLMIFMLIIGAVQMRAVNYTPAQQQYSISSQQVNTMNTNVYNGTVYEPFSSSVPSSYSPVSTPSHMPGGPRRAYDENGNWVPDASDMETAGDTGNSNDSPIGEPWIMVLFAALFAGAIALKCRKRA